MFLLAGMSGLASRSLNNYYKCFTSRAPLRRFGWVSPFWVGGGLAGPSTGCRFLRVQTLPSLILPCAYARVGARAWGADPAA